MKIILTPIGSSGDVHPFVGLGIRLRARGHRVIVATNDHFEPLARAAGLEFIAVGVSQEYLAAIADPDLWHPFRGFVRVATMNGLLVRSLYDLLAKEYEAGRTLVVAHSLAFGARIAQDKLGIPVVTVHLSPAVLRSAFQPPVLPGVFNPAWMPRWYKRTIMRLADAAMIDPHMGAAVNSLRAELGLPPVRRLLHNWWHSPLLVLAFFPAWFAALQPDWPAQLHQVGFPFYDERGVTGLPLGLEEFLESGEPPIVFTPGSAMRHGRAFFAAAAEACTKLGRRGVVLTRFADQVPALPAHVRHFDFVPLSQLLPRAAAIVHHGGIGTTAQGLAAGIPQMVMAMAHDQFDNAARVTALGVGVAIRRHKFTAPAVAAGLRGLLESKNVARRCVEVRASFAGKDALREACAAIEAASGQAVDAGCAETR